CLTLLCPSHTVFPYTTLFRSVKALPHAVANSFVQAMQKMDVEFVITNPEDYNLNPEITANTLITHNQEEAFENADFIYVKNWSRSEEHTSELQSRENLVCRLL